MVVIMIVFKLLNRWNQVFENSHFPNPCHKNLYRLWSLWKKKNIRKSLRSLKIVSTKISNLYVLFNDETTLIVRPTWFLGLHFSRKGIVGHEGNRGDVYPSLTVTKRINLFCGGNLLCFFFVKRTYFYCVNSSIIMLWWCLSYYIFN